MAYSFITIQYNLWFSLLFLCAFCFPNVLLNSFKNGFWFLGGYFSSKNSQWKSHELQCEFLRAELILCSWLNLRYPTVSVEGDLIQQACSQALGEGCLLHISVSQSFLETFYTPNVSESKYIWEFTLSLINLINLKYCHVFCSLFPNHIEVKGNKGEGMRKFLSAFKYDAHYLQQDPGGGDSVSWGLCLQRKQVFWD